MEPVRASPSSDVEIVRDPVIAKPSSDVEIVIDPVMTKPSSDVEKIDTVRASHSSDVERKAKEQVIHMYGYWEEATLKPESCIYNVPSPLRQINPAAYTPQVISIGPIHHGNEKMRFMEVQKRTYLKEFYVRTKMTDKGFLPDVLPKIYAMETNIRNCYAETSRFDSKYFGKMILLDAVFIIELFLRDLNHSSYKDDIIMSKLWLRTITCLDLILLENQLPYFVLDKLYSFAFPYLGSNYPSSFFELACEYFSNYKPRRKPPYKEPLHFTDLIRSFWSSEQLTPHRSIKRVYSVTKLHEAGVKFKPIRNACLLDIKLKRSVSKISYSFNYVLMHLMGGVELQMPCFEVDDTTEVVIRNLMALEQCHYPYEAYICDYISLMDYLINSLKDVDFLIEKEIIVNGLGNSDAVLNMVKKLCQQITVVNSCYYPLSIQLNDYCKNPYNRTVSTLRSVFFGSPWRGVIPFVAFVFLFSLWLKL